MEHPNLIFSGNTRLSGPSDFNGECPLTSYEFNNKCCCSAGCCWNKCTLSEPPKYCIDKVPDSMWVFNKDQGYFEAFVVSKDYPGNRQRYTYRVLQTIQMKLILLWVWAERAVLGRAKTALKFKYEI